MWVRFTHLHWHRFNRHMKRRYLPDEVRNVPAAVGNKAVADGHAIRMKKPTKAAAVEPDDGQAT